jgi:Zn-dependent protease/CBS domain-containing protein
MFLHRVKIATLAGFTVWIDASWLILAALLTWTLALGIFPTLVPQLSYATYWWMGVAGAIGLFVSIVLHELSHALVARRYDMPIAGITLFIFGGVAELHNEPTNAKAEFLMAIAGPIASMVLGFVLLAISTAGGSAMPRPIFGVLNYLGQLNWILALFNLVPAFPLDGGRILRAALWGWKKDFARATHIAARAGQFFGLALILYGVVRFVAGDFVGGIWLFFIGLFMHGAAGASRQELTMRRAFAGKPVSAMMQTDPIAVPPDLPIRGLVEDYFYRYYFKAFPVLRDGALVGCIMAKQVSPLRREDWDRLTVGEVMQQCSPDVIVPPDCDALEALKKMQDGRHSRLLVVENGQLRGVLALSDMLQYLSLKLELEMQASPMGTAALVNDKEASPFRRAAR